MDRRILVLDRDGVINFDSPHYVKSPDEWHPIPGSLEAIARFHRAGWAIFIATNQAGIARGKFDLATLERIHERMVGAIEAAGGALAGIEYCPHHPDDHCDCRKPEPGMLKRIEARSGRSLQGQPFVGDSLKDIRAAEAAGCEPVLVLTGSGRETLRLRPDLPAVYADLAAYADAVLNDD